MIGAGPILLFWLSLSFASWHGQSQTLSEPSVPSDTLISLRRTGCFGSCPDYSLTITADGIVTFEGRLYVRVKGVARNRMSREKLRMLIEEFEIAKYFSLNDSYETEKDGCPEVWTDYPATFTSIRVNGKSKSISHYYGCQGGEGSFVYPNSLTELESRIDEIVGTKRSIK